MATTTAGRVLLKFFLPPQYHHLINDTILDKKGISKLFGELAEKSPDHYSKIVSDLTRLGFEISTRQGTSITLKDLVSPIDKDKTWHEFEAFQHKVESGNDSKALKDKKIFDKYNDMMSGIEKDILSKGLQENKSLAKIILAGSRGSPAQYRGTIATQGIVVDAEGKPKMDIPIKSSYAEGLSLPEYLTTSFGARTGEVLKKISVAQGGYGCLEENTLVMMADYSSKPIKDVQVGEFVMGADMEGNFIPVKVNVKFDNGVQDVYEYFFRKGKQREGFISFIATDKHKVLAKTSAKTNYSKQPLSLAKKHFSLKAGKGLNYDYHFNKLTYIGKRQVWDLEVDHPDHLFVLANGAIVSNSKQFARALMPLQVVESDCGATNGIDVSVDDRESVGAFLAKGVDSYNRNNEVTSKMLNDLKHKGIKHITIRSPMTCQSNKKHHSGGLCQMCVGKREKGMAAMDSYIGLVAGTAVAEPLTESAMKARHSGGAATSLGGQQGFKLINQLANVPKTFIGRAPLAQEDGIITKLEPAGAGGHFISVNNTEHYIGLDQDPKFKVGDRVEQGQVLSTGLVDPREVVKYRGIGDGRKYYMEAMKKAFDDSGLGVNRRNFELIAKAAVDHVKITDHQGIGNYLPDQVVSYSAIEKDYQPRPDSKTVILDQAYGKYMEKPELHYTIGTRVTTSVIQHLKEHHIESVLVNDHPPHFEPTMVRLVDIPEHHDDWMHVLNSTNLAKRFVNMVNKGSTSDVKGPSPIPGLAYGVDFGKKT